MMRIFLAHSLYTIKRKFFYNNPECSSMIEKKVECLRKRRRQLGRNDDFLINNVQYFKSYERKKVR